MEASLLLDALRAALVEDDEVTEVRTVHDDMVEFADTNGVVWAAAYRDVDGEVALDPEHFGICTPDEIRAKLNAAARKAIPKSKFAYVDSKGEGHLPVHDEPHAKDAMGRWSEQQFETPADKAKAARKIVAAAKKFGVTVDPSSAVAQGAKRSEADFSVTRRRHQRRELERTTEHREIQTTVEVRDLDTDGQTARVVGTPIVYGSPYKVRDMFGEFTETMLPGAAAKAISGDADVRFLYDHKGMVLANTGSGTLALEDRADGLHSVTTLDLRQPSAQDLFYAIEGGKVRHMSIGFMVDPAGESWDAAQEDRKISQLSGLLDVSAVAFPASPTTSIMLARSAFAAVPAESKERLRSLYDLAKRVRQGEQLGQADGDIFIRAITALWEADDMDEEMLVEHLRSAVAPPVEPVAQTIEQQRQKLVLARARLSAQ